MEARGVPPAAMKPTMPPLEPALLLEHAEFVRSLARSLIRDPAGADDVEQETWLRALENGPRESSNLRGWLATVLTNVVRNRARSTARRQARERLAARSDGARADNAPPSSLAAEQSDTLRSVVAAVLALDEPYRATLFALYFQGLSAREFADRAALPEATVRSRHRRALATLRERLDREHGERETWCTALASLTGLESGVAVGVSGTTLGFVAALTLAIVGAGVWLGSRRAPEPEFGSGAALARAPADAASRADDGPGGEDSREQAASVGAQRREIAAGELRVTGVVRDLQLPELQSPPDAAAGVAVSLRLFREAPGLRSNKALAQVEVTADDDGRFEWRVADPGERPLQLHAQVKASDTHRAGSAEWKLATPAERSAELELRRAPHGDVEMRIEDHVGAPLGAVLVRVLKQDNVTTLEQTTNDAGLVRFVNLDNFGLFSVEAPGWTPVRYHAPKWRSEGGWEPGTIAMAPDGALRVKVLDGRGAPLAGAHVRVVRTPWERELDGDSQWGAPRAMGDLSRTSDERGEALFESVCAAVDLRVTVHHGKQTFVAEQRSADGKLLDARAEGVALRVEPGREMQVEASWKSTLELEFALRRSDEAPLGDVLVEVLDAGRAANDTNRWIGEARFQSPRDAVRGSFDVLDIVGPVVVFATDSGRTDPSAPTLRGLGYIGEFRRPSPAVAVARAEIAASTLADADASQPLTVELLLEQISSLSGTLLGRDGEPAKHRSGGMGGHKVHVVPSKGSRATADDRLPRQVGVEYIGESEFAVHGLAPGRYDVLVTEEIDRFYTFSGAVQRFPDLEAGTSGLELRLRDPGSVKVRLRTDADPKLASSLIVLMGALSPADDERLGAARAAKHQVVSGNSPWPRNAPRNFSGTGGGRDELGLWSFGCDPVEGVAAVELPRLAPGWYVFGVHPGGKDGRPYAPLATQLAYFEAGEYELDFRLTRVTDVRGVVRRSKDALTALELLDANGRPAQFLQLDGDGRSVTRQFVGSSGAVRLREVPHGAYRLRVGTPTQLDRGEFAAELELVVEEATRTFELELR